MKIHEAPTFEITDFIKTKDDAFRFMDKIDGVIADLFTVKVKIEDILEKKLSYHEKQLIIDLAKKNDIAITDIVPFQQFLMRLKEYIHSLPNIEISLAFDPKKETIDRIADWFRENIKKEVFLDLKVDVTIMGGALIGSNGLFKDYSLRKTMRDTLTKYPEMLTIKA